MNQASILAFVMVAITGCSHSYVARQVDDQITTCCPSEKVFCTDGNLASLAAKECNGKISRIGAGARVSGVGVQRNFFDGSVMGLDEKKESCAVFRCESSAEQVLRNPAKLDNPEAIKTEE